MRLARLFRISWAILHPSLVKSLAFMALTTPRTAKTTPAWRKSRLPRRTSSPRPPLVLLVAARPPWWSSCLALRSASVFLVRSLLSLRLPSRGPLVQIGKPKARSVKLLLHQSSRLFLRRLLKCRPSPSFNVKCRLFLRLIFCYPEKSLPATLR